MENQNKLLDFPRCLGFFINNRLPSRVYVIRRFHFHSYLRQHWNSDMMKPQGLIVIVQSLFGGHRPLFNFVVLPFVGVGSRNTFGGGGVLNASSPVSYVIPLLPSFLYFFLSIFFFFFFFFFCFPFLLLVVFALNGFKSRFLCYTSPPLFSLFLAFLFSSLWVVFFFF